MSAGFDQQEIQELVEDTVVINYIQYATLAILVYDAGELSAVCMLIQLLNAYSHIVW